MEGKKNEAVLTLYYPIFKLMLFGFYDRTTSRQLRNGEK
jgi:hypothetical protein